MDWVKLESQLPLTIAAAGRIYDGQDTPAPAVYWKHQWNSTSYRSPVIALLELIGSPRNPYVFDGVQWREDVANGLLRARVWGIRDLTVQVTIETMHQGLNQSAEAWADFTRARLHGDHVLETLRADGDVVVRSIGQTVSSPFNDRDNRKLSRASFDLELRGLSVFEVADDPDGTTPGMGTVERVDEVRVQDAGRPHTVDINKDGTTSEP